MTTAIQKQEQNGTIAQLRLQGKSYRQIADEIGCGLATINRTLQDEEVKAVLEIGTRQLTSYIPKVVSNYKDFLDSKDDKIKLDAGRDILKITGIAPTHTVNTFFTQINQKQVQYVQNTENLKDFMQFVASKEDIPEAEIEDEVA